MVDHMLTTIDNHFNPFTHFDEWLAEDEAKGYNTLQLLAQNCIVSSTFSEQFQSNEIEAAIEKVLSNPLYAGVWIRVTKDSVIHPIPIDVVLNAYDLGTESS